MPYALCPSPKILRITKDSENFGTFSLASRKMGIVQSHHKGSHQNPFSSHKGHIIVILCTACTSAVPLWGLQTISSRDYRQTLNPKSKPSWLCEADLTSRDGTRVLVMGWQYSELVGSALDKQGPPALIPKP